jgi:transcriptional antiterminator NusG
MESFDSPYRCCTVHTRSGEETVLARMLQRCLDTELLHELYIPKREVAFRRDGRWQRRTETLYPGYVFIDTQEPLQLLKALKRIPHSSRLIHDGEYNYYTLSAEEERFIRRIGRQRGDHLLGVSQVAIDQDEPYRKGDRVRIVSGDLLDFEGEIVGWDLHHRKAILRSALFGGAEIHAAVELLRKAAEEQTPQR